MRWKIRGIKMNKLQLNGTSIWDQVFMYHKEMRNSARLLYLYLLTNPMSNIAGIYKISTKRILFDLNTTDAILEQDFKILKYFRQVYRCGSYIIIRDASLFIQKPTKAIIKEWNKIIDKLPLKVKTKLERIKYKTIDGTAFKIENKDETPFLFDKIELKNCLANMLKTKQAKIENKKEGVQKEGEGINPPKEPRKELIIEEEEDKRKEALKPPKSSELKEKLQEENSDVKEIIKELKQETENDPSDWYFTSDYAQNTNEIDNAFTDEDDPYYVPTEEDNLKECQENNYEDEADSSSVEDDSVSEEEVIEDEIIMDVNCNNQDKIIQNIDSFMDEGFYRQAYKYVADYIIKKNNTIVENIGNKKVEYEAYFELLCNVLEGKNDDYLAFIILDFLQYKGFYQEINSITFARSFRGEGRQFVFVFREDTRRNNDKFYSKKAVKNLLNILYDYVENGEDKEGGLYCWYTDTKKKKDKEKIITKELALA